MYQIIGLMYMASTSWDNLWELMGEDRFFIAIPVVNPLSADLVVSDIVFDPPDPEPGEKVNVHVTAENQGAYDAGGFFLEWYADNSSAPAPPPFGNQRVYVPELAAGAEYTFDTNWTYMTSRNRQMYAYSDSGYGVYESDENNNLLGPVDIIVGGCKCDFNVDGDTDGSDAAEFISNSQGVELEDLANEYGRTNYPVP
jgi:hypothetical protein